MAKNRNAMWDEITRRKLQPITVSDLLKRINKIPSPFYSRLLRTGVFIPVGFEPDQRLYSIAGIEKRKLGHYQVEGVGDKYGGWGISSSFTLYFDPAILPTYQHAPVKVIRTDGKKWHCPKCGRHWVAKPRKDSHCYEVPTHPSSFRAPCALIPVAAKPDYCCPGCGRAVSREEKLFSMEDGRCKVCRKT